MRNFELTSESKINEQGVLLYRIKYTKENKKYCIKAGDLGGWIEKIENISGDALVSGNAKVYCDAKVYGYAKVSGNARVYQIRDVCYFSPFGSRNDTTTEYRTNNEIDIVCGCFRGNLEKFIERIKTTHGNSYIAKEYLAICEVIKIRFESK
ncbi:MAG: hypothetical protein LBH60_05450 [Prevotellaceae bacterium]|jgi:hypothetical protein|nr:hypothetical protein [Prevotellaceae bacterium]